MNETSVRELKRHDAAGVSELLGTVLGSAYKSKMTPSPLIKRLERMSAELDRGEDTFERKVRYLFWLN